MSPFLTVVDVEKPRGESEGNGDKRISCDGVEQTRLFLLAVGGLRTSLIAGALSKAPSTRAKGASKSSRSEQADLGPITKGDPVR